MELIRIRLLKYLDPRDEYPQPVLKSNILEPGNYMYGIEYLNPELGLTWVAKFTFNSSNNNEFFEVDDLSFDKEIHWKPFTVTNFDKLSLITKYDKIGYKFRIWITKGDKKRHYQKYGEKVPGYILSDEINIPEIFDNVTKEPVDGISVRDSATGTIYNLKITNGEIAITPTE